ncbi:YdiU family protein [Notoacmeibacter sp. MSK16QG-6]|uniref:protein adenylyltransferase SelO n=1 Tax=Notoacmeibacter sp. MSK16QG-6 TaxID=2957982 RepID=UPI00209FCDCD|nr:YdiU family protein [Notoacmeibacter sp. MSK16QG-6]MCP1199867.1 YdiU family protein [Notoacmeibacter sp. MSK16QG-6]
MTAQSPTFHNSYTQLPDRFFAHVAPARPHAPALLALNEELAEALGLDVEWLRSKEGLAMLSGERLPNGAASIAMAYAGHQFGGWVPQLGDGRAILVGEVTGRDGFRRDLQLKGAGPTPFSRGGDGLAWLGPVLREYVVSEAMAKLGVATTRALAAVSTGGDVIRETVLPGAVLTRVARSHIRVGTFQYFSARRDVEGLKALAYHVIERHYPQARQAENPYLALLENVIDAQVDLVSHWQSIGFIHGVMNTDNMTLSGETIDYGPCAFMDDYHPETVFSSIDRGGRYAYSNQPPVAQWNLAILASALLPILNDDKDLAVADAQALIDSVSPRFDAAIVERFRRKIGLDDERAEDDSALIADLLSRMAANMVDFTNLFRALGKLPDEGGPHTDAPARDLFVDPTAFDQWAESWRRRLGRQGRAEADRKSAMDAVNPAFIPRNHRVEAMIAAALNNDLEPMQELMDVLSRPYRDQPDKANYADPPTEQEHVTATFCGT